jgi:hypothetical protein
MQGEAAQFVDPSEIPAAADVARLGQALTAGQIGPAARRRRTGPIHY